MVEKVKWDGSLTSRTSATRLGGPAAPHVWAVMPGAWRERGRGGAGVQGWEISLAGDEWWVITGFADQATGPIRRYHVDAAIPPQITRPGVLRFIDLDLDLVIEGGRVELRDLEEFRERAVRMHYPPRFERRCWAGLLDAESRHARAAWPFDGFLDERLAAAAALADALSAPAPVPG